MSQFLSRKLIIILISIIVIFGVIGYTARETRPVIFVETFIRDTFGFFKSVTTKTTSSIYKLNKRIVDINNAYEENKRLKSKLANYTELESKVNRLQKENEELRSLTDTTGSPIEIITNADVIWRSADLWQNQLIINKGSSHGIRKNMAVRTVDGLVGNVVDTTHFTSTVNLLTNINTRNRVAIEIQSGENLFFGILKEYDLETHNLKGQVVANTDEIELNSLVVTSGLGGVFPPGIVVGRVQDVTKDEIGLAKGIIIESAVNFSRITSVQVLNNKSTLEGILDKNEEVKNGEL